MTCVKSKGTPMPRLVPILAVVVHPAANFRLVVGEVLQVDWRAVDHRGRRAGKSQKLPIEVVVEP